jgi:predicted secreted protein
MFQIKPMYGALVMALVLAAQSGNQAQAQKRSAPRPPEAVIVRENANGQRIPLAVGDTLLLRLRTDTKAGYRWVWLETDPQILRREKRLPSLEEIPSSQGYQEFELTALKPGKAVVELAYEGPKRFDDSSAKILRVEVRVVPQSQTLPDYGSTFTRVRRMPSRPFALYTGEDFISAWSAGRFWGNRPPDGSDLGPPSGPGGIVITRY